VNPQPSSPQRRHAPRRIRPVVVSLIVAAGVAFAALAITRLNLAHSLHALANVRPGFVAAALTLLALSLIARAECWYVILRGTSINPRISRLICARATMI